MNRALRAVFARGGTSRGLLLMEEDLAKMNPVEIDAAVLVAMGSPDPYGRQIDGLGGGISSLSKVAILGKTEQGQAHHVTYNFGQVAVREAAIDWSASCGNISAAAAMLAFNRGLVPRECIDEKQKLAKFKILATNSKKLLEAIVPVEAVLEEEQLEQAPEYRFPFRVPATGSEVIAGVPGSAAPILLRFLDPGGTLGLPKGHPQGGSSLPTGNEVDELGPSKIPCSIIDVGIPTVFVRASDVGPDGEGVKEVDPSSRGYDDEFLGKTNKELDNHPDLFEATETLRAAAAVKLGLVARPEDARGSAQPKIVLVGRPREYKSSAGDLVTKDSQDLTVRPVSVENFHASIMGTSLMALSASCAIPGTVPHDVKAEAATKSSQTETAVSDGEACVIGSIRAGHPAGVADSRACVRKSDGVCEWTEIRRTARIIMEGKVLIPPMPRSDT
eukprot:Clim_evm27s149 gene=Clim_evmTU27s149